jgi:hypothetical protein
MSSTRSERCTGCCCLGAILSAAELSGTLIFASRV